MKQLYGEKVEGSATVGFAQEKMAGKSRGKQLIQLLEFDLFSLSAMFLMEHSLESDKPLEELRRELEVK